MTLKKMEIGKQVSAGWELFKPNMGLLVPMWLVAALVGIFTCGILGIPMIAGQFMVVQRLQQNDPVKPAIGDLFQGFQHFLQLLIIFIVAIVIMALLALLPIIGQLAGLAVMSFMVWPVMRIIFDGKPALEALKEFFDHLTKGNLTNAILVALVALLINAAGSLLCAIGVLFTGPFACAILVTSYNELFSNQPLEPDPQLEPAPLPPTAPPTEPAPSAETTPPPQSAAAGDEPPVIDV